MKQQHFTAIGPNVGVNVSGNILLIAVDLTQEQGESASGKSVIVGTTQGNAKLSTPHGTVSVGLNVYVPKGGVKVGKKAAPKKRQAFSVGEDSEEDDGE